MKNTKKTTLNKYGVDSFNELMEFVFEDASYDADFDLLAFEAFLKDSAEGEED